MRINLHDTEQRAAFISEVDAKLNVKANVTATMDTTWGEWIADEIRFEGAITRRDLEAQCLRYGEWNTKRHYLTPLMIKRVIELTNSYEFVDDTAPADDEPDDLAEMLESGAAHIPESDEPDFADDVQRILEDELFIKSGKAKEIAERIAFLKSR